MSCALILVLLLFNINIPASLSQEQKQFKIQTLTTVREYGVCGVTIVGGKEVKPHSMPWMVSIQKNSKHICGGTLIKDQWVLTAAHCKKNLKGSLESVTALLGAHSLSDKTSKGPLRVNIQEHHIFPSYSQKTKADDIMLCKLQQKVKSKVVKVLALPKSVKDMPPGTTCTVAGWGITTPQGTTPSDKLMEATVIIMDRELCACLYRGNPDITKDMLCARNTVTKADSCAGDSGGPLLCKKSFVGVTVGGGPPCGDPKKPGVYTRLSEKQLTWIRSIVKHRSNGTSWGQW